MDATIKKAAIAAGIILLLGGGIAITAVKHHAQASRAASASAAQRAASGPSVQWVAAHASDPATRTAEQQIQAQLGRYINALNSQNYKDILAILSPNCVWIRPNGTTEDYHLVIGRGVTNVQRGMVKEPDYIMTAKINSCRIDGNAATMVYDFYNNATRDKQYQYNDTRTMTLTNTGGQWLITSLQSKRLPHAP